MMASKSLADLNLWGVNRTQAVKHARKGIQNISEKEIKTEHKCYMCHQFSFWYSTIAFAKLK